jgi:predicted NUDIX family NTP pyrophosphohydrolase
LTSAGILLYRLREGVIEVLLGHPGGPLWKNRDEGAWTIPKGLVDEGEDLRVAAGREFREEMGFDAGEGGEALAPRRQRSGKTVHVWAVEGDCDAATCRSNEFSMEWPPKSGRQASFPEIDRAGWFDLERAKRKILPGQAPFLDELSQRLAARGQSA